jgi:hypothetical protein
MEEPAGLEGRPEGAALLTGSTSEDTTPEKGAEAEAAGVDEDGSSGTVMKVTEQEEPTGALPLVITADDTATDDAAPDEAKNDPGGVLEGMATTVDTPSTTEDAGRADADPAGVDRAGTEADAGCE